MRWDDARGDIVSRWLIQLAVFMAVLAVLGYEVVAVAMTHLQLDEDARQVAAEARSAYRDGRDIDEATEAGLAAADEQGIEVIDVATTEGDQSLVFRLERHASTLFVHRIGPLESLTVVHTSRAVPLVP